MSRNVRNGSRLDELLDETVGQCTLLCSCAIHCLFNVLTHGPAFSVPNIAGWYSRLIQHAWKMLLLTNRSYAIAAIGLAIKIRSINRFTSITTICQGIDWNIYKRFKSMQLCHFIFRIFGYNGGTILGSGLLMEQPVLKIQKALYLFFYNRD